MEETDVKETLEKGESLIEESKKKTNKKTKEKKEKEH
jgi:hypothetical protein